MPRFDVTLVARVWISAETIAPTREEAEQKILKKGKRPPNESGFSWLDGEVEHCSTTNLTILNKLPKP